MNRLATFLLTACLAALCPQTHAQPKKPDPDIRNARYGPHQRNVLDLWKAKSDRPTPLVIFIHGGGFRAGDKSSISPVLLRHCLKAGISVAAIAEEREAGTGDSSSELRGGVEEEVRSAEDRVRAAAPRRLHGEAEPPGRGASGDGGVLPEAL